MYENNYDFLMRMREIFKAERRDETFKPQNNEVEIDSSWDIVLYENASKMLFRAARDLQEYLQKSMNVALRIQTLKSRQQCSRTIFLETRDSQTSGACNISVTDTSISLCGSDERGVLYGVVHLEDLMNLRQAPFFEKKNYRHEMLTRMRSTHSGSGLDDFPDWQLNAILHAGFNAIDIFVQDIDTTTRGYCNINDVIERAAEFGLEVVLYSYLKCFKHPDDKDADEYFDSVYGKLARKYPKAKAIHLVGESLEFPSKDPAVTGKAQCEKNKDGFQEIRPATGYYPCSDYPAFITKIRETIDKVNPNMEIIFNTYNWGWAPLEVRRRFLENFPERVTLQVTYDIFKSNRLGKLSCPIMDYSIFAQEPGYYFISEVETAAELEIKNIRVTSNLAGASWDFGCVPYVPVPHRWIKRMLILKDYLKTCDVNSFYDSHHYGWWPNPCNDLAKGIFSNHSTDDLDVFLKKIAARDYGNKASAAIVETWRIWSEAMDYYVASNEDQYGPWRVGPAYPFIFQAIISRTMEDKEIKFPTLPHSYFGWRIIKTLYRPYENTSQSPGPLRYPLEIEKLEKMLTAWNNGLDILKKTLPDMDVRKLQEGQRLFALGKFIRNAIKTTIGIKRWWLLNMRLQVCSNKKDMLNILDKIEALAVKEKDNVTDTFECVNCDSRLGWEPRMEYVCDKWHLEWKLRQLEHTMHELDAYRNMIKL